MNYRNYILKIFNLNCFQSGRPGQEQFASLEQKEDVANDKVSRDIFQVFALCTNRKAYERLQKIRLALLAMTH